MPEYLIEVYASRVDGDGAALAAERARAAAEALSRAGAPVRLLRSIVVPGDETCLYLYEAPTAEIAAEASRRAGIRFQRVVEAHEVEDPGRTEEHAAPAAAGEYERPPGTVGKGKEER